MWYAVTAYPVNLKKKEIRKEFYRADIEVVLNAGSREELEKKLNQTLERYPGETLKYLRSGIKFIKANNVIEAKRKSKSVSVYFDHLGQYHLF